MNRIFSALTLALATVAGPAFAADGKPAPFTIKGGTPIDCNNSPFGRFLPVGIDQEVLVTRISGGTPVLYQLSGGPMAPEREVGMVPNVTRYATATADLDGDGDEEYVMARLEQFGGNTLLRVATYGRVPGNDALQPLGEFFRNFASTRTFFEIQVTAADLYGRRDGSRQIVVGTRSSGPTTGNALDIFALDTGPGGSVTTPGDANPLPFARRFDVAAGAYAGVDTFRLAAGNPLLEPAEQVMMITRRQAGGGARLGYTVLRTGGGPAFVDFPGSFVEEDVIGATLAKMTVHVADLGDTVAHEVLVGLQEDDNGFLQAPQFRVRNYTTTRDANNNVIGATLAGSGANYNGANTGQPYAIATGQVDRVPGDDIVLARIEGAAVRAEVLDVAHNVGGLLIGLAPANPAIAATAPALGIQAGRIEVAIGDANSDAVGDVYLAFIALAGGGNNTPVTKVRRFSLDAPANENAIPPAASFALRASYDFPSNFPVTSLIDLRVGDVDQDSVVARISAQCRRVREPLVRTVVKIPPYWERLQDAAPEAAAAIGRTITSGGTVSQRYNTFTSHDVSGYFGAQFGSETIGFKVVAKATAGGNWQTTRGVETAFEQSTEFAESQSQSQGEGLVVVEENLFDCYSFNVERGGQQVPASTVRACEIVRVGENGVNPRLITGTDLVTWDTSTASDPIDGTQPAQWKPLHPDWANIALFRPVTSLVGISAGTPENLTDGRFNTAVRASTATITGALNIDLGEVRDITNIRLWHEGNGQPRVQRLTVHASENPFTGFLPPSGVPTFAFDPRTDNGVDRWNIWTRNPATDAPLRARYIRIQVPPNTSLAVSEVQVFGEVHREPVDYPDAVCDPIGGDGTFLAVVADKVSVPNQWRAIEVRGDLLWSGVPGQIEPRCGSPAFYPGFRSAAIWDQVGFAGTAVNAWSMTDASSNLIGSNTSIEHSARFGAEIEAELGLVVGAVAGIAYEFATGVTQESGTTMYWGQSLQYAGAMRGFNNPTAANCDYRPQPYSYTVTDRSSSGYTHRYTVVDYVVRGLGWSRIGGSPPAANCFPARGDAVFSNSFEPAAP
jgi:hypothetical protein